MPSPQTVACLCSPTWCPCIGFKCGSLGLSWSPDLGLLLLEGREQFIRYREVALLLEFDKSVLDLDF
jgi:hypothetical protein